MQTGYFNAAWNDISHSHGWLHKLLLLSLLMFVPVFGWVVLAGYLLGWARDAAWGVQSPMPARLFGNEDGKLYSRGFYAWLTRAVFIVALWAIFSLTMSFVGTSAAFVGHVPPRVPLGAASETISMGFSLLVPIAALALAIASVAFVLVGWMRMALYGRLSAGFQLERIWAMLRHDMGGIFRIVGIFVAINAAAFAIVVIAGVFAGLFSALGAAIGSSAFFVLHGPVFAVWIMILTSLLMIAAMYACMCAYTFSIMVTVRALGHWTKQFDVPHWRGQDDPLPFEIAGRS